MTQDARRYELAHDEGRTTSFDGWMLASSSSAVHGKERWIELALYRTTTDRYVLHGVGVSLKAGESQRSWVLVTDDPAAVVHRLEMNGDQVVYLPTVARRLLSAASNRDPGLDAAYRHVEV